MRVALRYLGSIDDLDSNHMDFDAGIALGNGNTFPAFFDALGLHVFVNPGVSFRGGIFSTGLCVDWSQRPGPDPDFFEAQQ